MTGFDVMRLPGLVTSLFPRSRSDKGTTQLSAEVETIIQAVVERDYLTKQQKSQQEVCGGVRRCVNAGINLPHNNTVPNRRSRNPTLPCTTSSNPRERGGYDSEAKAALTLTEFECRGSADGSVP